MADCIRVNNNYFRIFFHQSIFALILTILNLHLHWYFQAQSQPELGEEGVMCLVNPTINPSSHQPNHPQKFEFDLKQHDIQKQSFYLVESGI